MGGILDRYYAKLVMFLFVNFISAVFVILIIDLVHSRVSDVTNSDPGLFGRAASAWLFSRFNSRINLHICCVTSYDNSVGVKKREGGTLIRAWESESETGN